MVAGSLILSSQQGTVSPCLFVLFFFWYLLCTLHSSYTCFHLVALVLENVKITPDRVKILVGETLVLNCTGETTFNGRLQLDWDFPRAKVSHIFFTIQLKKTL